MPRFCLAVAAVGLVLAAQAACGSTHWEDWSGSKSTTTEHTPVLTIVEEPTVTTYETISGTTTSASASSSSIATSSSTSTPTASTSPSSASPSSSSTSSISSSSSSTSTIVNSPSQASQSTGTGTSQDTDTPTASTEDTLTLLSSTDTVQVTWSPDTGATNTGESSSNTPTQSPQETAPAVSSSFASTSSAASASSRGSETVAGDSSSFMTSSSSPIDSQSASGPTSVSSSTDVASSDSGSASKPASSSASTITLSSSSSATGDDPSAPPLPISGSVTTESLTISSTSSDNTLLTVIVTTHTIVSEGSSSETISSNTHSGAEPTISTGDAQSSGSASSVPSATSALTATPVIPSQTATCGYGVMPWCTPAPMLPSSYGCLCPYCWAPSELCEANKPSSTSQCPDLGWLCALATDESTVLHSMPPGTESMITPAPSTSALPWWDYISSLHATDDSSHTSDAHFNATLLTSTKLDSDHHTTLFPYRAWECVAGPVCYPPNFDFGCLFPNPLSCANGIGAFLGIWPRPKIPFPPPVGPPELDYQLEATTLGGDDGGDPSKSKSQSTSKCSSTMTYSTCSTVCSIITVSSSHSESCTSTCTTTSDCSGSDADATTTASACSYSPYWNDPVIASSVSSLLAQFPFSFLETIELTSSSTTSSSFNISTLTSGGCSSGFFAISGTTVSRAVCTDQLGVPWTSVPSGAILPSSSSSTPLSTASFIAPTSAKPSSTKATPTISTSTKPDWAKHTKDCHDYDGEFHYSPLTELKRKNKVYCAADASPKGDLGLFKWGPVADGFGDNVLVKRICQSLVDRRVVLTDDNAQCYRRAGDFTDGSELRILFRVSKSYRACGGNGTPKGCNDDFCDKDFAFADYGVEACMAMFQKMGTCKGKTWDKDSGDYDTAGGTYYNDCVAWTIVAVKTLDAPPNTDDTDPGAP